jgi:hypothetical protein
MHKTALELLQHVAPVYQRCMSRYGSRNLECEPEYNTQASAAGLAKTIMDVGQFHQFVPVPVAKAVLIEVNDSAKTSPSRIKLKWVVAVAAADTNTKHAWLTEYISALMFGGKMEDIAFIRSRVYNELKTLDQRVIRELDLLTREWNAKEDAPIFDGQYSQNFLNNAQIKWFVHCRNKLKTGQECSVPYATPGVEVLGAALQTLPFAVSQTTTWTDNLDTMERVDKRVVFARLGV